MTDKKIVAENLTRALKKSGITPKEVEEKSGVSRKRLARWLESGFTRTRRTKDGQASDHDLKEVCRVLGIEMESLWKPASLDFEERIDELAKDLVRITQRQSGCGHLVIDLFLELVRRHRIAVAADKLATERPDLVPESMAGWEPFRAYWSVADQWSRLSSSDDYYLRLLTFLTAEKLMENKKRANLKLRLDTLPVPPSLTLDQFIAWIEKNRPDLTRWPSPKPTEASGWMSGRNPWREKVTAAFKSNGPTLEAVVKLEDELYPLLPSWLPDLGKVVERMGREFPAYLADNPPHHIWSQDEKRRIVLDFLAKVENLRNDPKKQEQEFWSLIRQAAIRDAKAKQEWREKNSHETVKEVHSVVAEPKQQQDVTAQPSTANAAVGSEPTVSPPAEAVEKELSPEKQEAIDEAMQQAAKPQRRVPGVHSLRSKLSPRKPRAVAEVPTDLWPPNFQKQQGSAKSFGLVRWTGGKWRQAETILHCFPDSIETYYEPFLGGGAVLHRLLSSDIEVRRIRCSDICQPLVEVWNLMMNDPNLLASRYAEMWEELGTKGKDFYNDVRNQFNQTGDPCQFFFLLRTCRIGSVRFNRKGHFTTSLHFGRRGAHPDKAKAIIDDWHSKLQDRNVQFTVQDYRSIRSEPGDFLYLDPPYASINSQLYYGKFDFEPFFPWLAEQKSGYALSLNGFVGDEDRTVAVPRGLYDERIQLKSGVSAHRLLNGMSTPRVTDSLYVKRR